MGLIGLNQALTVLSSSGSSTGESVSCPSWCLEVNWGASVVAQMVKNLPAMQEAWVQSLGQEDPLEKGVATHSSILAFRIPWIEEPGSYIQSSPWSCKDSDMTEWLHFHFSLSCIGEGNGNPLQCSCLENPRDAGSLVGCRLWGRTESDITEAT